METPRIRYAPSKDGTLVAYAVIGSGAPLVFLDTMLNLPLDLRVTTGPRVSFFDALAATKTAIILDWHGSGFSDRRADLSLASFADDVEAVVEHLRLDRFDLWSLIAAHAALEFTARHPQRVRKLVVGANADTGQPALLSGNRSDLGHLLHSDWQIFTEMFALRSVGWSESARAYADYLRKHWTPESFEALESALRELDALPRAAAIDCEALVIAVEDDPYGHQQSGRRLAGLLPRGELMVLPAGSGHLDQLRVANEFLGEFDAPVESTRLAALSTPPFRTILFTDVEAHTEMMQRLGDARGRDLLREHERLTREALAAHSGAEVKTMGDGFMASFGSAQSALDCAIALQRAFGDGRDAAGAHGRAPLQGTGDQIRIRIGVNAGEPIAEDDDLFGASVILAARTASQAQGGEVLVTDVVRQLVAGKGFVFADRGEVVLRGFEDPVRLHELSWRHEP